VAEQTAVGEKVRTMWKTMSPMPGGKRIFSFAVGRAAPYTGSIGAIVDALEPQYARVLLRDRKKVRNHLNCVHAIALMNLGEMTTGLAMMSTMPADARGILSALKMEYHVKARGLLTAECRAPELQSSERREYEIIGEIRDAGGTLVATARATWLVGPMTSKKTSDSSPAAA
jgi:acyl-coenzyme A thioesterase PaaI-like protein